MSSSVLASLPLSTADSLLQEIAQRFPTISITHVFPGFVATGAGRGMSLPLRWLFAALQALLARSADDCGEYMMYGVYRSPLGFSSVGERGDVVQGYEGTDEEIEKMWNYAYSRPNVPYKN